MKLTNAFMNTFLIAAHENNVFVENKVLTTDEKKKRLPIRYSIGMPYTKQIF